MSRWAPRTSACSRRPPRPHQSTHTGGKSTHTKHTWAMGSNFPGAIRNTNNIKNEHSTEGSQQKKITGTQRKPLTQKINQLINSWFNPKPGMSTQ